MFEKLSSPKVLEVVWQSLRTDPKVLASALENSYRRIGIAKPRTENQESDSTSLHAKLGRACDAVLRECARQRAADNLSAIMIALNIDEKEAPEENEYQG